MHYNILTIIIFIVHYNSCTVYIHLLTVLWGGGGGVMVALMPRRQGCFAEAMRWPGLTSKAVKKVTPPYHQHYHAD